MPAPHLWFRPQDLARPAAVRLFCLPHAGSGASSFYRWRALLPATVSVCPVLLPGRELGLAQPPLASIEALVDGLTQAASGQAAGLFAQPYALYGHSMGALLAYEWTRAIAAAGLAMPRLLAAGGRNAPQLPLAEPDLHALDEAALLLGVRQRYGALPAEIVNDPAARALFLPVLRADLAAVERYRHQPGPRLNVRLAAFAGVADDRVTAAGLDAWADLTRAPATAERLPGDHFFHFGAGQPALAARLAELLAD